MNLLTHIQRFSVRLMIVCAGMLTATSTHARTCTYNPANPYGNGPGTLVTPLNINALTVGRDVPNGTVLYRQTVTPMGLAIDCTGSNDTINARYSLPTTPLPLSNWNGNLYPGRVYETGVPGIGIALWYAGNAFPYSRLVCGGATCQIGGPYAAYFDISLIKIGPVSPGVIQGANLPSFQVDYASDNVLPLIRGSFIGSINIVSRTCTTPDVNVDMGQHQTKAFSGSGSATPWKDFNIQLQNCPAFLGASAYTRTTDTATGWSREVVTATPNTLGFSLQPTTTIVDPTQGIVALKQTTSGPAAATGVGLQIANASNQPVSFNSTMSSGITPTATPGANYSIPLRARYIQTGSAAPTPGPADTSVMFTINYQ
ncbi:fimbrial protein [Burkholderia sp. Z1]|uniref:fimbrial protein n=1 Tax=Burkholderia sp. Z1 TaxID=2759039 RepID=UPI0018676D0F|nr:fimbrial protein [Burkholderia sp. Z1]